MTSEGLLADRIAEPTCKNMANKDLKQRPGTVKRVGDVCLLFVELEQAEAVLVRSVNGIVTCGEVYLGAMFDHHWLLSL